MKNKKEARHADANDVAISVEDLQMIRDVVLRQDDGRTCEEDH